MNSKLRRFEILLPLKFNDGSDVPSDWIADAVLEIVDQFGALSYETHQVEGYWQDEGTLYRDHLSKLVVDLPDTDENRQWMRDYKARWKQKLDQLDIWLVSFEIEVD